MSAEFYISFSDEKWFSNNLSDIESEIRKLRTFSMDEGSEFQLLGNEGVGEKGRWTFDVRMFVSRESPILIEISAHPKSIEKDLTDFFAWLRKQTAVSIIDDDGEPSGW